MHENTTNPQKVVHVSESLETTTVQYKEWFPYNMLLTESRRYGDSIIQFRFISKIEQFVNIL